MNMNPTHWRASEGPIEGKKKSLLLYFPLGEINFCWIQKKFNEHKHKHFIHKIYDFLLYLEKFRTFLNKTKSYSFNESETVGAHNESGLIG